MTEVERNEAFQNMLNLLRRYGLAWAATQVQETIRAGKLREKQLSAHGKSTGKVGAGTAPSLGSRGRISLTGTEAYSAEECLQIITDSVETSTVQVAKIEEAAVEYFESQVHPFEGVFFEAGEFDEAKSFRLSRSDEARSQALQRLQQGLKELRLRNRQG